MVEGSIHEIAVAKDPYRPANCPELPPDAAGYQVFSFCIPYTMGIRRIVFA